MCREGDRKSAVHFLHVSKAGGSAIKSALRPYAARAGLQLHPHAIGLQDVPEGERVFFFVRTPIERFVSGFLSRQREGRPRYAIPWSSEEKIAFENFSTPNDLAEALSGSSQNRYAAINAISNIRQLARPLTTWLRDERYLGSRLNDVLFIGTQEAMNIDFARLLSALNLPSELSLPNNDFEAHRAPANSNRQLSEAAKENIRRWYATDCKLYDYCDLLSRSYRFHMLT